ncbi:hypothetical protein O181_095004 [Austropuccinia psidii MF-1]|uniref:Uncharacterized protein n=1 Tax=Austropuccinia psidii MF-1 TaxID=1389203 RepID=A0A9Q3PBB9_9BASI|nr:hypothetical protein [Austropuccinia psidii MF-1]
MTVNIHHCDRKLNKCEMRMEEVKSNPNLEEKTTGTKKKQYKSDLKDDSATNTAYSIIFKPFIPNPDSSTQSHFAHDSGCLQASSAPQPIGTSIPTKKNFYREEYSSNFDSKKINTKTIDKDNNPSTNK